MRTGKIVLVVIGSLLALAGLAVAAAGGTALIASGVARDGQGYFTTSTHPFQTPSYAITSEDVQLGTHAEAGDWFPDGWARVRLRLAADDPSRSVFVGIARQSDVDAYLGSSAHDQITDLNSDPFRVDYRHEPGAVAPGRPADQPIWVASAEGPGRQVLSWDLEGGRWAVVVMASDASPGVAVQADVGLKVRPLVPVGVTLLVVGLLVLAGGVVLIVIGARRSSGPVEMLPPGPPAPWGPDGSGPGGPDATRTVTPEWTGAPPPAEARPVEPAVSAPARPESGEVPATRTAEPAMGPPPPST